MSGFSRVCHLPKVICFALFCLTGLANSYAQSAETQFMRRANRYYNAKAYDKAIAAGICALLIAGILLWNNSGKEQPSVTLATDTTAQQVVEAKQDSLPEQQESIAASEQAEKTPVDNYAELNAKIPYGAYDIVGVQAEIIAPPGMDMATISRVYMGSDSPIYLVVMNGGETNPGPGSRIIIPKLREHTVRK